MKSEILNSFVSRLPDDDSHPYRTGAWLPQAVERRAWDLDVIGEIPDDLNGVYLRNTENSLLPPISFYHPFDGDGMLHSISFANGSAEYHNRFVRTEGFIAEQAAGEALWAGMFEAPDSARAPGGWGARTRMKDAASTDVVVHNREAIASFWQCGDLYRLDPVTLEPLGKAQWGGQFPPEGVSAHTKIDQATGEMLFFNYSTVAPFMHYGVVDASGDLVHYVDVPLPGARLPHDMAFTQNYAIVNDCPMFWDPELMAAGLYLPKFHRDLPTRFGVIPRRGSSEQVRWFEAEPTYVLHWINAYEDGDEIVLDGFFQADPMPRYPRGTSLEERIFGYLDLHKLQVRAHRWRFNLSNGASSEFDLSQSVSEFGMTNGLVQGRPYRYSYEALPCKGWFGFEGLLKRDLLTGQETQVRLPQGHFASETVMAPRDGATGEDDGYLLTYVSDLEEDRSYCLILDSADPSSGPVAKVLLPERICSGTHAFWASAAAL